MGKYKDHLTVLQLIELLTLQPQDSLVWTEGCDCYGAANSVWYEPEEHTVVIGRCISEGE